MKYAEQARRRQQLTEMTKDNSLTLLFSGLPKQKSLDQDFPFSVDRDFFYFTGLDEPGEILLLFRGGDKRKEKLFIRRPDPHTELYHGQAADPAVYQDETGIEEVLYLDRFDWEVGRLLSAGTVRYLYLDFQNRWGLGAGEEPENAAARRILAVHPYLEIQNLGPLAADLRRIKGPEELAAIREAVRITGLALEGILEDLDPGVLEKALEARGEFEMKKAGSPGYAFNPIVAGGANSVVLHYEKNNQPLAPGDLVVFDLGAEYKRYSADISRTFPVNGVFTEQQRFFYRAVLTAQERVVSMLKPGLEIDKTLDIARETLLPFCREAGVAAGPEDMKKLLPHGICHYLGLDTHDVGRRDTLTPGMVITIEPGLYLPQFGFGIRIEDDAEITETGCCLLPVGGPKTPEEIESFFKDRKKRKS
ncbi:MAG: aminopeptidase P N-terminal domain-containing protein [Treponema sp.]|jgi:Xaa-Pro aminopeptidase|nr:aminopeptidase P N-terminal domain-containing protein [Treponema sp.]